MKIQRMGVWMAALGVLAAAGFVVYRWRTSGFKWGEFASSFTMVDWRWMSLALLLILATYLGRSMRWEIMLRPLAKDLSFLRIMTATCIGFTAVVLFGRAGEAVRPYLIARREGVSFSSQVAAWLVERFLDLLMVLVIFGIALTQVSHSSIRPGPGFQTTLEAAGYTAGITGLACLALLVALRLFRGQVQQRLIEALSFLLRVLVERIERFLAAFDEGMQSARHPSFILLLVTYSVIEWTVIYAAFYCVFRAFPASSGLGVTDIVIVMGFVCFGGALQIPGVGGGVQLAAVLVLTEFYGMSLESASGIALALWVVNWAVIVPIGLALAFHEGIKLRSLRNLKADSPGFQI